MTPGYSGTPLVKKLGLKAGQTLAVFAEFFPQQRQTRHPHLGFMAEKSIESHDRHYRRHHPRTGPAARLCRYQGLRCVGYLVGTKAGRA